MGLLRVGPSKRGYMRNIIRFNRAKDGFHKLIESIGYEAIGEYVGASSPILIRCNNGHEYSAQPSGIKTGNRCAQCKVYRAKLGFYDVIAKSGYAVIGEYKTTNEIVKVMCNHGHEYYVKPANFKTGKRCPQCAPTCPKRSKKVFYELLADAGYKIVRGDYVTAVKKVDIQCNRGHEYQVRPADFKNGKRCPSCADYGFRAEKGAHFYLTTWTLKGHNVLKFGITNNESKVRFSKQSRHTEYNYKSHVHLKFASGLHAIWLEKIVKQYQKGYGSALSKEEFPDGFTETIDYSHYANVMRIVNDYVDGLVDHGIEVEWG